MQFCKAITTNGNCYLYKIARNLLTLTICKLLCKLMNFLNFTCSCRHLTNSNDAFPECSLLLDVNCDKSQVTSAFNCTFLKKEISKKN